jgi:hypothetical protein
VLVAAKLPAGKPFAVALSVMLVSGLIGLVIAVLIPRGSGGSPEEEASGPARGNVTTAT